MKPGIVFFAGMLMGMLAGAQAQDSVDNEKALRYHGALQKRPSGGYLFDRFFSAWLEKGTVEDLQGFLEAAAKSDDPADDLLLGYFFDRQGNDVQAIAVLDEILKSQGDLVEALLTRARILGNRQLKFAEALRDLDAALAAADKTDLKVEIGRLKGRFLARDGKPEEALKVWLSLLELAPEDEDLHEDLVELLAGEGLFEDAISSGTVLAEKTKDPYKKVLRELRVADLIYVSGDVEKAVKVYSSTLEKTGANSWIEREILTQLERVFRRKDDLEGLKETYAKLVANNPARLGFQRAQAGLFADLNEGDEAVEVYRRMLEVTPGERTIREAYIELLNKLKRSDEALAQLRVLIDLNPEDAELELRLATLLDDGKDEEGAEKAVAAFLEKSDRAEFDYLRAGRFYERTKNPTRAGETYDAAMAAFPDSVEAQETKAAFLFRIDEVDAAIAAYLKIGRAGGKDQAMRIGRALTLQRLHADAFALLKERAAEFENDFNYLGDLIAGALRLDSRPEGVQDWLRRRLLLAEGTNEVAVVLKQADQVYSEKNDRDALVAELSAKRADELTVREACLLASLYEKMAQLTDAIALLNTTAKRPDEDAGLALRELAEIHKRTWNYTDAAKALEQLIALPGEQTSENYRALVGLYAQAGLAGEGLKWVPEWKKLSPGSSMPWLDEARLLVLDERMDDAIEVLRSASRKLEDNVDIRARLGTYYNEAAKPAEAMQVFWGLYEDAEESMTKLRWVGSLHETAFSQGQSERLVESFQERRRSNRASVEPLFALAEIYRIDEQWELRRDALLEASRLKPDDLEIVKLVAASELEAGDWEAALATLDGSRTLDKTSGIIEQMARIEIQYGEAQKGYRILAEAASANSGKTGIDPNVIIEIGELMAKGNDWETAVDFLGGYVDDFPNDYRIAFLHAVALEENSDTEAAMNAFLALIEIDQELPEVAEKLRELEAKNQPVNRRPQNIDAMKTVPAEAMDFYSIINLKFSAYQYRQAQQGNYYPGQEPKLSAPGSVPSSQKMGRIHLLEIARGHKTEEKEATLLVLEKAGIPLPEVALQIRWDENVGLVVPDEVLEDRSDDPAVCALWLTQSGYFNQEHPSSNIALFEKACATLEKDYPRLAFQAGITAATKKADEQTAALFEKALTLTDRMEDTIDSGFLMQVGGIAGLKVYGQTLTNLMSPEQQELLKTLLKEWYLTKLNKGDSSGRWLFTMMATDAMEQEDADALLNYIAIETSSEDTTNWASPFGYSTLIRPIGFPPTSFSAFPGSVRSIFAFGNGRVETGYLPSIALHKELLGKIDLKTIENPILHLLFLSATGDHEDEMRTLIDAGINRDDEYKTDMVLFAAGLAEKDKDYEKAFGYLTQAASLSTNSSFNKAVLDSAIVNAAVNLGPDHKSANAAGRQAASRILATTPSNPYDQGRRQEVITAITKLGMHSEAKRQTAAMQQAAAKRNSAMSVVQSQQQQGATKRITDLIGKNQRDKAIEVAAKELRSIGKSAASSNGYGNWFNTLRYLQETLSKHGLTPDVVSAMESENKGDRERIIEFGYAASLLGSKNEARKAFEALLKEDPANHKARGWLAFEMVNTSDRAEATAAFIREAGDAQSINEVCTNYISESDRYRYNRSQRSSQWLATREVFASILETLDPSADNGAMAWAVRGLVELEQQQDWGSEEIPHIHELDPVFDDRELDSKEGATLDKARADVHRRLCTVMLKFPVLAEPAFVSLCPLDQTNDNAPEWETRARSILTSGIPPTRSDRGYGSEFSRRMATWSPMEFLMVEAYRRGDFDTPKKEMRDILEKSTNLNTTIPYVDTFTGLLKCAPEDFSQTLAAAKPGTVDPARVVDIWDFRELPASQLMPFFLDQIEKTGPSQYYQLTWAYHFADSAFERDGYATFNQILDSFSDVFLGKDTSLEDRRKAVADLYAAANGNVNNLNYNAPETQFMQLLAQFASRERFLFPVFAQAKKYGYEFGYYLPYQYRSSDYVRSPERLRRFFGSAPIYSDEVADFDAVFGIKDDSGTELFIKIVQQLKSEEKSRTAIVETVTQKPDSFGKSVILAMIDITSKPGANGDKLLSAIGGKIDRFEKLPEPALAHWVSLLESLSPEIADVGSKDPVTPAEKASSFFRKKGLATQEDRLTKFLSAKQATDVEKNGKNFEKIMLGLMKTYSSSDREKAKQIFRHGWGLIRQRQKTTGWDGSTSYNGWKVGAELIDAYFETGYGGLEQLGLWIELMREDKEGRFPHSGWSNDMKFSIRLRTAWDKEGGPGNVSKSITPFLKAFHAEVGDGPISLFSLPLFDLTSKLSPGKILEVLTECDRIAALADAPEKNLAREWAIACRFYCAANPKIVPEGIQKKIPGPDSWQAPMMNALRDEAVSPSWHFALAQHLTYRGEFAVSDEMAMACADVLALAMENESDFNAWGMFYINRVFVKRQGLENWDAIAGRIRSEWWKKNRFNGRPRNQDIAFDPVREVIITNLDLILRTGDKTAAKRFLKDFPEETAKNDVVFALLVEHGAYQEAASFLENYWNRLDPMYFPLANNRFFIRYSTTREKTLNEFIPMIKNPDLQLFAECLIKGAIDPRIEDKLPTEIFNRSLRLKELVPKFKAHAFTNDAIRKRVMETLLLEDQNFPVLESELATAWENTVLSSIAVTNDVATVQLAVRIPAAYALLQLTKNNFEPLTKLCSEVATSPGDNYYRREAFEQISVLFLDILKRRGHVLKPEQWAKYRKGYEIVLSEALKNDLEKFTDHELFIAGYLLVSGLSGEPNSVSKWRNALGEDDKKFFIESLKGKSGPVLGLISQSMKTLAPNLPVPITDERRIAITTELLNDPSFRAGMTGPAFENTFTHLSDKKLLTKEEILERSEELENKWPRQGFAAAELARFETERGNFEAALKWIDKAIETGGEPKAQKFNAQKSGIQAKL